MAIVFGDKSSGSIPYMCVTTSASVRDSCTFIFFPFPVVNVVFQLLAQWLALINVPQMNYHFSWWCCCSFVSLLLLPATFTVVEYQYPHMYVDSRSRLIKKESTGRRSVAIDITRQMEQDVDCFYKKAIAPNTTNRWNLMPIVWRVINSLAMTLIGAVCTNTNFWGLTKENKPHMDHL